MKRSITRPPAPHFHLCAWYEQVESIMHTDPRRFRLFSPATKRALAIYLEMRERARVTQIAA